MGAAVSARADEVPGKSEALSGLYATLEIDKLDDRRRRVFEDELSDLYERHGGDRLFLEKDERKKVALFKLFEREALTIKSGASAAAQGEASDFRKKRLSYSMAPAELRGPANDFLKEGRKGSASGERARRPSTEFRSPEYLPVSTLTSI